MQRQLDVLGNQLVWASMAICGLVFGVGLLRGYGFLPMLRAAVYRMEFQGWSNRCARWEAMILSGFDSFQKDTPKGQFLLNYRPGVRREPPSP